MISVRTSLTKFIFANIIFFLCLQSCISQSLARKADYDYVEKSKFNQSIFYLKGKAGILDKDSNVIIPPIYDFISPLNDECYEVKKNNKSQLINKNGTNFIDTSFDQIFDINDTLCKAYDYDVAENECTIINLKTKKQTRFKKVFSLNYVGYNTFIIVYQSDKNNNKEIQVIDANGNKLINSKIDEFKKYCTGLLLHNKEGYLFYKGDIRNNQIISFLSKPYLSEGPAFCDCYLLYDLNLNKRTLLDYTGKNILNGWYESIDPFFVKAENNFIVVKNGDSSGILDFKGKVLLPLQNNFSFDDASKNVVLITEKGKKGLINVNGKILLTAKYKSIYLINNERALVYLDSTYSFYDVKHSRFEKEQYQDYNFINSEKIALKLNGKWGISTTKGELIVPHEYDKKIECDFCDERYAQSFFIASKNNKQGIVSLSNKMLIPFSYDYISKIPINGTFMALNRNKYGRINLKNEIVIPFVYDEYYEPNSSTLKLTKNGKKGWLNYSGEILIPFEYDDAMFFAGDLAAVKRNGKWGFIDKDIKLVIPFQFDNVDYFKQGRCFVRTNGISYYIDNSGKRID